MIWVAEEDEEDSEGYSVSTVLPLKIVSSSVPWSVPMVFVVFRDQGNDAVCHPEVYEVLERSGV